MNRIIQYAQTIEKSCQDGAMLFFDGELYKNPAWTINQDRVSFHSGNTTQTLWIRAEREPIAPALADIKDRLLVLIPAPAPQTKRSLTLKPGAAP